jgi:inosine-uridine nucleoside N-ribohydrolase
LLLLAASTWADEPAKPKVPVLFDTDIGDDIDDALALGLILTSPELDVRGITTAYGDSHTRALIVCRLLHLLGRTDIPVAAGKPALPVPDFQGQMQYGLRPAFSKRPEKELAADFLYKQLKARPGELTLLAVGPLGNIAELLTKHPDCKPWIKRLVLMGGSIRVGYANKPPADAEWNIKADVRAAQTVFRSGVPIVLAPLDATTMLKLEEPLRSRLFGAGTPLTKEMHALYQLWHKPTPILFDPVAVTLCFTERFCKMEELAVVVDDKGITRVVEAKPNARVAMSIDPDAFLKWYVERVTSAGTATEPARIKLTNLSKPLPRGMMPSRVHVAENYETDIERRWWLAGLLETKTVPPGSKRCCRGVLTNDFDGRMGDPQGRYTAVIFNPVPGPPMGKDTRLTFRYWLKGTGHLKVQLYTLSKGYHRHLTLADLPQGSWQSTTVDMTAARKPDGSGGPLSEDERIDDIQFYTDAGAELLIDDIVLYDAAPPDESRPFPQRLHFTGWFDTGKQGKEWPGEFEIVAKKAPYTWKAASSVAVPGQPDSSLRVDLRGGRPMGQATRLRFRYHLTGADGFGVALMNQTARKQHSISLKGLKKGEWIETTVDFSRDPGNGSPRAGDLVNEIRFVLPRDAKLLVDDVLLFEAGK